MQDLTHDSTVMASANQMSTQLDDEAIVLDLESGIYYGLAQVGARIWAILQQPTTCTQIVDALRDEYDVDPNDLKTDVLAFVRELHENRLVNIL
jgi:hypothetical protein